MEWKISGSVQEEEDQVGGVSIGEVSSATKGDSTRDPSPGF